MKLEELGEVDFARWKHHPVTELVMKYLGDFREALIKEVVGSWEIGGLDLMTEQEARGRCVMLREILDLELQYIQHFYGVENATETDPN
jgi:hypothetical protein